MSNFVFPVVTKQKRADETLSRARKSRENTLSWKMESVNAKLIFRIEREKTREFLSENSLYKRATFKCINF